MEYNNGSPGESLQNRKANDRTLRMWVGKKQRRQGKVKGQSLRVKMNYGNMAHESQELGRGHKQWFLEFLKNVRC